ncbi:PIN domain-containing protein [Nostoc sp. TCL26-01]|uniref:PIN domain-containing protein n=1 Tax=Nostoc sp. TCL26-01 TaxID=2576904 RepID=UPI0015B7D4DC|nr:hypothetical protein [Nostoc sp. TCL26-01]QLE56247.1 hypothetical protein FD725_12275 [Nostoc sp. TCL26-01]
MIIYVETNFLIGIAKGQDTQGQQLLQNLPLSLHLVVPSICFVESLITLDQGEKYNLDFLHKLDIQINESERDNSVKSRLLLYQLEQSRTCFLERNNEVKERFYITFNQLIEKAKMITFTPEIFQESFGRSILEKHLMDKLILECIIHHARLHPHEIKCFLSSNSHEFRKREVSEVLQDHNIQYFHKTQNFLGWLNSQPN